MLLPYISDPDTGSRIPSMSTGGAAMKAMMNTEVAVSRVGIMITPNQPKYRRLLVDVMNDANLSQGESERSERSQIEDVTNYCSNVAQGFDDSR